MLKIALQLWLSASFILAIWATKYSGFAEVSTKYGRIRGKTIDFENGNKINTFLGIRYAKPPVGELRFRAPEKPEPWTEVFNATEYPKACPQAGLDLLDEDCLRMSIYSPQEGGQHPVMLYIHGNGWIGGGGQNIAGHFLSQTGVIVVTINYRLLALGYLTTEDSAAPGNAGMLDMVAALEFIRDCIADFGGDPNRVTLAGHSSGAVSASLHLLSPKAKGLFHRAVLFSGADMAPWAMIDPMYQPKDYARYLAEDLDCDTSDSMSMVACLRTKTTEDITDAAMGVLTDLKNGSLHITWSPVVDGPDGFLPDTPENLRKQGKFAAIPVLLGITPNEMSTFLGVLDEMTREEFLDTIRAMIEIIGVGNQDAIFNAIAFEYTYWPELNNTFLNRRYFMDIATTALFHAPNELVAKYQSQKAPTFMFNFDYLSVNDDTPAHMIGHHNAGPDFWFGYPFHDEFTLNITDRIPSYNYTEEDKHFSNFTMTLLTNFVKYGNPSPNPVNGVTWSEFREDCQQYLQLNHTSTIRKNYRHHKNAFFNEYFPTLLPPRGKYTKVNDRDNRAFTEMGLMFFYNLIQGIANSM